MVDARHLVVRQQLNIVVVELPGHELAGLHAGDGERHGLEGGDRNLDLLAHASPSQYLVDHEHGLERRRRALGRLA